MPRGGEEPAVTPLSVERTFVLQFRRDADLAHGPVAGRIEHVRTGHATHFASVTEMLDFLRPILAGDSPPSQPRALRPSRPRRRVRR
jgi:hypothetical protein